MDTSDPEITFDDSGVCNHCHTYEKMNARDVFGGEEGRRKLQLLADQIKQAGKGKPYDCVIGVSGGVDSTYVAYKVKEIGLRPLAVHLDNGWNSELAIQNIENVLGKLNIDLLTHVIDWEEFKDLQLAFLKASTPDSEIPSDHAIVALMRKVARKHRISYIVSGCNVRTETHLPRSWSQGHRDWLYIKSVHQQFGTRPLKTYPHFTALQDYIYNRTQNWVDILNYVDYVKADAKDLLLRELGWRDYGGKHFESIYTRFYQGYILPKKFGFDKRRSHLSSMICSGQIKRTEALMELSKPSYAPELQKADLEYVVKKFELTQAEFEQILKLPVKTYWDYPSNARRTQGTLYRLARAIYHRNPKLLKVPAITPPSAINRPPSQVKATTV
jgi:N-acetyl sugar amidotransferase